MAVMPAKACIQLLIAKYKVLDPRLRGDDSGMWRNAELMLQLRIDLELGLGLLRDLVERHARREFDQGHP